MVPLGVEPERFVRHGGKLLFQVPEAGGAIDFRSVRQTEDEIAEPQVGEEKIVQFAEQVR